MNYPRYPEYKPSGVEWLGEVPGHWSVLPTKRLFRLVNGSTPASSEPDYWDGDIPWLTPDDLGDSVHQVITNSRRAITNAGYASCGTTLVPSGSIVLSTRAPIGHLGIAGVDLCTNQGCRSLVKWCETDSIYYYYAMMVAKQELVARGNGTTFLELSKQNLESVPLLEPDLNEQRAIATFLDRETARIDALIEKKRRFIELLQEKRAALISRAVTRGLDPNVPLKDSGVEWLGQIPAHWVVKSIKRTCLVRRGASPRPIDDPIYFDDNGECSWVRISDVTSSYRYLEKTEQRLSKLGESLSVRLEPGELFLSIAGSVGKPIITKIKCCIHDGFVYFWQYKNDPEFLYYVFACGRPYQGLGKFGTQLNLNTDTVGDIKVGWPPLDEQGAIAAFLDHETTKLDALHTKVESAIDKLKEYRVALIAAVVTGKIDVRAA